MIAYDPALCTGCGDCIAVCPREAIALSEGRAVIRQALCDGCGACIQACPTGALFEAEIIPVGENRQLVPSEKRNGTLVTVGAVLFLIGKEILPKVLPDLIRMIAEPSAARHEQLTTRADTQRAIRDKTCICRDCGSVFAHHMGTPCRIRRCPHCGGPLIRQ